MDDEPTKIEGELQDSTGRAVNIITHEQRQARVWDMKVRGLGPTAIAKELCCSVSTVYSDTRALAERYRDIIIEMDPITLVAQNAQHLEELERVALFEMDKSKSCVKKVVDPKTNLEVAVEVSDPNRARFFQAALQARSTLIRLYVESGIIPRDSAKMFKPLADSREKSEKRVTERRTTEQIEQSIEDLLNRGSMLD